MSGSYQTFKVNGEIQEDQFCQRQVYFMMPHNKLNDKVILTWTLSLIQILSARNINTELRNASRVFFFKPKIRSSLQSGKRYSRRPVVKVPFIQRKRRLRLVRSKWDGIMLSGLLSASLKKTDLIYSCKMANYMCIVVLRRFLLRYCERTWSVRLWLVSINVRIYLIAIDKHLTFWR